MQKELLIIVLLVLVPVFGSTQITVHPSKKYLVEKKTGKPFFWLSDTGWELFHRLTREDAVHYLDTRKKQGFNIIKAVALAESNGLKEPNRYGDVPFTNLETLEWAVTPGQNPDDPAAYDYWDHVDYIIQEAAKRNLYIGLLPTWGDKVAHMWGEGPRVFNENNAYGYAQKIAERYKNQWNIIWILGGDRPGVYERGGKKYDDRNIWRAMAKGIEDVCGKDAFITYHPGGSADGSSAWFHNDSWLDMNALQSGHGSRDYPVWDYIRQDLKRQPQKPTIDMEPCYEDHPVNPWDGKWSRAGRGFFSAAEIRGRIYRGVFAGGCGAAYGHHSVWQFLDTALYPPIFTGDIAIHWREALNREVAGQMHHLKDLFESKRDFNRVEDGLLIASERGSTYKDLIVATKSEAGTYALVYLPQPRQVKVNIDRLKPGVKKFTWFNPSTGKEISVSKKARSGIVTLAPPDMVQSDWVLMIDVK